MHDRPYVPDALDRQIQEDIASPPYRRRMDGSIEPTRAIVVVCAWCQDHQERTREAVARGYQVSHGICPSCLANFQED